MSEEKESKSVEGPFGKLMNNKPTPLRQPNCSGEQVSVASSGNNAGNEPEAVEQNNVSNKFDGKVLNSTLNVNAAEFIPYSQMNRHQPNLEDIHTYVRNQLECLALSPANYVGIYDALCIVLGPYMDDDEVMKSVIDIILYKCISEKNLYYNGARLLTDLQKSFGTNIRSIILSSCQEEYINSVSKSDIYVDRVCGFGLFLAELYLQTVVLGKPVTILGEALFDVLSVLLKNVVDRTIKCACQILKLIGVLLEENTETSPGKMEELFSQLRSINENTDLDPNLRFIINNVIEMRDSNWGRDKSRESSSTVGAVNSNGYDNIIFYGPEGVIITREEESFLHESMLASDGEAITNEEESFLHENMPYSDGEAITNEEESFLHENMPYTDGEAITNEEESFLHENMPSSDDVDDCLCDEGAMNEEMFQDYEEFLKLQEQAGKKN